MQKAITEPVDNAIANCDDETATILAAINNANLPTTCFHHADWGNGDQHELVNGMYPVEVMTRKVTSGPWPGG